MLLKFIFDRLAALFGLLLIWWIVCKRPKMTYCKSQ